MTRTQTNRWLLALLLLGCNGMITAPEGERPVPPTTMMPTIDAAYCETVPSRVGAAPLRRLTRAQYETTALAALGIDTLPEDAVRRLGEIPDGRSGGFASTTDAPTPEILARYVDIAEDLAVAWMAARPASACDATDAACVEREIATLAPRLFRRPLEVSAERDELADYVGIWDALRADVGAEPALETAVAALLASPSFVYHAEPVLADDATGELVPLDPYALANRLSFLIWQAPPDAALIAAASEGHLADADGVAAEARRMIADARFAGTLDTFFADWLGLAELDGVESTDPTFTPELRAALRDETLSFVRRVVTEEDARFETLLTAPYTVGTPEVAEFYGAPPPDADGVIELDASERSGLLTQAGFLAQFAVYPEVHRGLWVRTNLLCDPPNPPPLDPPPSTAAERLSTEPCRSCHERMDTIGFAFADYDIFGRFRPELAPELPMEPAILMAGGRIPEGLVGELADPRELAERLGTSPHVESCVATQWYRYAVGRAETDADGCAVLGMGARFTDSGGDVRELIVAIATSDAFRFRSTQDLTL
ncbi:MAG: DUF1592 domain-containing protein [Sandaracinaceae bacterium]